jgi:hypothetical protein
MNFNSFGMASSAGRLPVPAPQNGNQVAAGANLPDGQQAYLPVILLVPVDVLGSPDARLGVETRT